MLTLRTVAEAMDSLVTDGSQVGRVNLEAYCKGVERAINLTESAPKLGVENVPPTPNSPGFLFRLHYPNRCARMYTERPHSRFGLSHRLSVTIDVPFGHHHPGILYGGKIE